MSGGDESNLPPSLPPSDLLSARGEVQSTGRRQSRRPDATSEQRALALLTRREHSRRELIGKLTARGIEPQQALATVDRLAAAGWQDDARFAELLVRSRAATGYGPIRIRAELGTHGLDRDAIAAAMESFEGDWFDCARDLVRRRFPPNIAEDRSLQRKAADFLVRRGFALEHLRAAIMANLDDDS